MWWLRKPRDSLISSYKTPGHSRCWLLFNSTKNIKISCYFDFYTLLLSMRYNMLVKSLFHTAYKNKAWLCIQLIRMTFFIIVHITCCDVTRCESLCVSVSLCHVGTMFVSSSNYILKPWAFTAWSAGRGPFKCQISIFHLNTIWKTNCPCRDQWNTHRLPVFPPLVTPPNSWQNVTKDAISVFSIHILVS